jgi:hypothetical protein
VRSSGSSTANTKSENGQSTLNHVTTTVSLGLKRRRSHVADAHATVTYSRVSTNAVMRHRLACVVL